MSECIICPRCKHEHYSTGSHDDDSGEHECDECEFRFHVELEYEPSFTSLCVDHKWVPSQFLPGRVFCKYCESLKVGE